MPSAEGVSEAHGNPVVELRSVSQSFGSTKAVDRVSLRVFPGETLALLGPSGCGKTTTLRIVNRLGEPDSGEVLIRGRPISRQRPEQLRRSIGYVIQEGGLFPHLNVFDNVGTVPRLLRWKAQRVADRCKEVLHSVGLPPQDFGPRMPEELSGGQRQRVGVARALASDPDLMLMDEPFSALDPVTRDDLHQEFLRLQSRLNKTVIIVTHDMIEAGRLADRIALMNEGRVVQEGPVADLIFRPATDFVRAFFAGRRRQMIFETLRLDDLLDSLTPLDEPGDAIVRFDGQALMRELLGALANQRSDCVVSTEEGRHNHRYYGLASVRSLVFADDARTGPQQV